MVYPPPHTHTLGWKESMYFTLTNSKVKNSVSQECVKQCTAQKLESEIRIKKVAL